MTAYKGYYIDGVIFQSKADIDRHIKNMAIKAYKTAVTYFFAHTSMEASVFCDEKAQYLHDHCGMEWGEIEAIELSIYGEGATA